MFSKMSTYFLCKHFFEKLFNMKRKNLKLCEKSKKSCVPLKPILPLEGIGGYLPHPYMYSLAYRMSLHS